MTVTETDIANSAILKVGGGSKTGHTAGIINNIDTDQNKVATICRELLSDVRDDVLRTYMWNCAQRRAKLRGVIAAITNATTGNPVVVTAANNVTTGDHITIETVAGMTELNDLGFLVANATSAEFSLQDEDGNNIDGSAYTPYTSGGTASLSPVFQYKYQFALPDSCLRVIAQVDPDNDNLEYKHAIEGDYLLTDEDNAYIKYVLQLTDPDKWDSILREVIALRLAIDLAIPLTGSTLIASKMEKRYKDKLAECGAVDFQEGTLDVVDQSDWLNVRTSGQTSEEES